MKLYFDRSIGDNVFVKPNETNKLQRITEYTVTGVVADGDKDGKNIKSFLILKPAHNDPSVPQTLKIEDKEIDGTIFDYFEDALDENDRNEKTRKRKLLLDRFVNNIDDLAKVVNEQKKDVEDMTPQELELFEKKLMLVSYPLMSTQTQIIDLSLGVDEKDDLGDKIVNFMSSVMENFNDEGDDENE